MPPVNEITFYGILDTGYVSKDAWISKYDDLANGGAGIIQIRAKQVSPSERLALTREIVDHRAKLDRPIEEQPHLVINDDIDLALDFPGLGLHVGRDDIPPQEARRRLGPNRILGLATHTPEQVIEALRLGPEVLSYFAVGPIFATKTKPSCNPVGLDLVKFVAQQAPELPFFCIGGITRANIHLVADAGASGIVSVSDTLCAPDTSTAVRKSIAIAEGNA